MSLIQHNTVNVDTLAQKSAQYTTVQSCIVTKYRRTKHALLSPCTCMCIPAATKDYMQWPREGRYMYMYIVMSHKQTCPCAQAQTSSRKQPGFHSPTWTYISAAFLTLASPRARLISALCRSWDMLHDDKKHIEGQISRQRRKGNSPEFLTTWLMRKEQAWHEVSLILQVHRHHPRLLAIKQ